MNALEQMIPVAEVERAAPFTKVVRQYVLQEVLDDGDKKRRKYKMEDTEVQVDEAYMVYFPQGHSIRVDANQLYKLGLEEGVNYRTRAETEGLVEAEKLQSPKQIVQSNERKSRRRM